MLCRWLREAQSAGGAPDCSSASAWICRTRQRSSIGRAHRASTWNACTRSECDWYSTGGDTS